MLIKIKISCINIKNTTNTGIGQNVLIIKITTKEQNKLYLYVKYNIMNNSPVKSANYS